MTRKELTRRDALSLAARTGGGIAALGAIPWLAACGGDDTVSGTGTDAGVTAAQVASATGTISVLEYDFYKVPEMDAGPVKSKWTTLTTDNEYVIKAQPKGSFDVAGMSSAIFQTARDSGRRAPLDPALLSNADAISPVLRRFYEADSGQLWAVPYGITVSELSWSTQDVPEPKNLRDLLKPEYMGAVGLNDSPNLIVNYARGLGLGDPKRPERLSPGDLEQIKSFLEELRPQVRTLFAFGEETNLFKRGDIKVAFPSYGSVITASSSKRRPVKGNLVGAISLVSAFGAIEDGNRAAAYRWINEATSTESIEASAIASGSVPATPDSVSRVVPKLGLPELNLPLEQLLEQAPIQGAPPAKEEDGVAGLADWVGLWNEYKAGF